MCRLPGQFHKTIRGQDILPVGGAIFDDIPCSASSASAISTSARTDYCAADTQSTMHPPQQISADCMASLSAALSQMAEMQVTVILQYTMLAI